MAQDSSVTRSDVHFKHVFARAGLRLLLERQQQNFPKELFKVKMCAPPCSSPPRGIVNGFVVCFLWNCDGLEQVRAAITNKFEPIHVIGFH